MDYKVLINSIVETKLKPFKREAVISGVLNKVGYLNKSETEPVLRTAKTVESNFTDEKLDYKSKKDFWAVDNGFIVRSFKTGDVINES